MITVAWQKQNFDSDVMLGSYQIQDLLQPCNNIIILLTLCGNAILPKDVKIPFVNFVWHGRSTMFNII